MISPADLAAIRARHAAATPGEWRPDNYSCFVIAHGGGKFDSMPIAEVRGWGHLTGAGHGAMGLPAAEAMAIQHANAAFLSAAHQDIPALLSHIAELEAENARLREALSPFLTILRGQAYAMDHVNLTVPTAFLDAARAALNPIAEETKG